MLRSIINTSLKPISLGYISLQSQFSTSTLPPKIAASNIRNQNLKFEGDDYWIQMYPFYPQVYKKKDKNIF